MMRFIQYWAAEEDRINIVKTLHNGRVNNSVRNKKRVLVHGTPPYGYRSINFELAIFEDEAQWVRMIFHWYVIEGLSLRSSESKIKDALEFAGKIRAGLAKADGNFAKQREMIEALDVKVTLTVEDGKMKIYPEFCFDKADEGLLYNHTKMV